MPRLGMKEHPPYSEANWRADRSSAESLYLTCPDCGYRGPLPWYGPRLKNEGTSEERHYRACWICGFTQEADGSPPYRRWKSSHLCQRQLGIDTAIDCEHCGQTLVADRRGVVSHMCARILPPSKDGYHCQTCGRWQGRETAVNWPRRGSG